MNTVQYGIGTFAVVMSVWCLILLVTTPFGWLTLAYALAAPAYTVYGYYIIHDAIVREVGPIDFNAMLGGLLED